jgi:hypothetical protein
VSILKNILLGEQKPAENADNRPELAAQPEAKRRVSFGFAPNCKTNQIIIAK